MNLEQLLLQKADIDRQIAHAQSEARKLALDEIRSLMSMHGLIVSDLATAGKVRASTLGEVVARKPVAIKYKDSNGNSWTGRGLKPKWLTAALGTGKSIEDFKV